MFKDDANTKYFCFKNGFWKINKYHFWRFPLSSIYQPSVYNSFDFKFYYSKKPGLFEKFFDNITFNDITKKSELMAIVGYLTHDYLHDLNRIIIISDVKVSKDQEKPFMTGKSLLINGVAKVLKGSFDFNSKAYTRVDYKGLRSNNFITPGNRTTLFHIDDVFNKMSLEPFLDLMHFYKFVFTTNEPFKNQPNSIFRRFMQYEIANFYNDDRRPKIYFNNNMLHHFNLKEWNDFFSFMIRCSFEYFQNQKPFLF